MRPVFTCRVLARSLVRDVVVGKVDSNDSYSHSVRALRSEVPGLRAQVAAHAIDLLNHRLGKDLHLSPELHLGGGADRHRRIVLWARTMAGDDGTERTIAATSAQPRADALRVQYSPAQVDIGSQPRVIGQQIQVVIEAVCNPVAKLGVPMEIRTSSERLLELLEEPVLRHEIVGPTPPRLLCPH